MHANQNTALPDDEQAWTDMDAIPLHLHPPSNNDYMTIVDVSSIHFITIRYCECLASPAHYLQLLNSKCFLATILKPRTAFTFWVLDNFIWDNLECGTLGMNYFSKLRCITSNVFPHAVLVCLPIIAGQPVSLLSVFRTNIEIYFGSQGNGGCWNYGSGKDLDIEKYSPTKVNLCYSVLHAHNLA